MTLFKIWADRLSGWDEYDSCVVVAESAEDARNMLVPMQDSDGWELKGTLGSETIFFHKSQGEIHIEEVDLSARGVVCASFNAG